MATIIRREKKDYGGEEIFVEGEDQPIYAAPHVKVTDLWLDGVVAARVAARAEAAKRAAVDDALQAEFERRKAEVAGLYDKTPGDAVTDVFASDVAVGGKT